MNTRITLVEPPAEAKTAAEQKKPVRLNRRRHIGIRLTFIAVVVLPTLLAGFYLHFVANDQFHSDAAFAVRSEDFGNPLDALSAFTQVGTSPSSDAKVLHDFIRSQPLVRKLDEELDLRAIYAGDPSDLIFALPEDASIERLVKFWTGKVDVIIDPSTGVISLRVIAFDRDDARIIAEAIIRESQILVEDLSRIAQEDATRFAREDVSASEERLRDIRRRIQVFRADNDLIDPTLDAESQMGVIAALQSQLAVALVDRQSLLTFTSETDQRVRNLDNRIEAIRRQIDTERGQFATATTEQQSLIDSVGSYQELLVELDFAERAYQASLAGEEQARAEARRTSRYLAIHIAPTEAEESLFPERNILTAIVLICLLAIWSTGVLIYYNVRDRG